ncbi:MAG: outer membrane protein assembly factor BamD [Planctomycetota bacterium]|jgi:hypothetical protein
MRIWGTALCCLVAVAGCYTAPPSEKPPEGRVRDQKLAEALAKADQFLADDDPDQAYQWYDHAAALDSRRTADDRIASGKLECGRRLAVEGEGVDLFGLVADRRQGIEWLVRVSTDYRFSDHAPAALYYAAVGYRLIDEPDVAVLAAERLIRDYPESAWAEAAEYERVRALLAASRAIDYDGAPLHEAQWRLEMYEQLHPNGANSAQAGRTLERVRDYRAEKDYRTARWYAWNERDFAARFYYQEVINRFPKTTWADRAKQELEAMGPAPPDPDADTGGDAR